MPIFHEMTQMPAQGLPRAKEGRVRQRVAYAKTYSVAGIPITVSVVHHADSTLARQFHDLLSQAFPYAVNPAENNADRTYTLMTKLDSQKLQRIRIPTQEIDTRVPSERLKVSPVQSYLTELKDTPVLRPDMHAPNAFGRLPVRSYKFGTTKPTRVDISPAFKDLLAIAADAHRPAQRDWNNSNFLDESIFTHCVGVAVPTEKGPKGVLLVGPPGVGKSELAAELLNHGARLVGDDVVHLWIDRKSGKSQMGGVQYPFFFLFKNLERDAMAPLKPHYLEPYPDDNPHAWTHLSLEGYAQAGLHADPHATAETLYHPGPVDLHDIFFLLPWNLVQEPTVTNLLFKSEKYKNDPEKFVRKVLLESGRQWNRIPPENRRTLLDPHLEERDKVEPEVGNLLNVNDKRLLRGQGEGMRQNQRDLVAAYLQQMAESEYRIDNVHPNFVANLVGRARRVFVIGQWTPPNVSKFFAQRIVESVKKANQDTRKARAPTIKLSKKNDTPFTDPLYENVLYAIRKTKEQARKERRESRRRRTEEKRQEPLEKEDNHDRY